MTIAHFSLRLLRLPFVFSQRMIDQHIVEIFLRLKGVKVGRDCNFSGFPIIKRSDKAIVEIKDQVTFNSRVTSNPLGLSHPTIIGALRAGSHIEIGSGTGISGASILAITSVKIGRNVLIGAGACIWDTDFHPLSPEERLISKTASAISKPILIEDNVFIGARALLLKGVHVGEGAVIGAGSVVTRDVGKRMVVGGNPACVIRQL